LLRARSSVVSADCNDWSEYAITLCNCSDVRLDPGSGVNDVVALQSSSDCPVSGHDLHLVGLTLGKRSDRRVNCTWFGTLHYEIGPDKGFSRWYDFSPNKPVGEAVVSCVLPVVIRNGDENGDHIEIADEGQRTGCQRANSASGLPCGCSNLPVGAESKWLIQPASSTNSTYLDFDVL
jgi:hypothetical protein